LLQAQLKTGSGTMKHTVRIADAVQRLKGVFLEVPGTQLSVVQASELSGLEPSVCESVLSALEDARFLKRGRDGRYLHWTADSVLSPAPLTSRMVPAPDAPNGRQRSAPDSPAPVSDAHLTVRTPEHSRSQRMAATGPTKQKPRRTESLEDQPGGTQRNNRDVAAQLDTLSWSDESRLGRIARRAHEIYENRGGEHGKALEDWLRAEREIDNESEKDR
jgi:hypothetical protein